MSSGLGSAKFRTPARDLARRNRLADLTSVHPSLHWKLRELLLDGPRSRRRQPGVAAPAALAAP